MKRLHILGLTCVCLGIAAALLFRVNIHAIAAAPSSCGAWNVVPSANNSSDDVFKGIATIAANDIWAVGYSFPSNKIDMKTLIEHWDGTSWSIVPSPNVPSKYNYLSGVTAISATDVWAVGTAQTYGMSLIEHWNGSTWSLVTSPSFPGDLGLNAVAAASATDVWAVGSSYGHRLVGMLTEHWNGTKWSIVPSGEEDSILYGVTVVSSNDVWAVGYFAGYAARFEHWNGTAWSTVNRPEGALGLFGVAAVSATDVWAVGTSNIDHWNGSTWSIVSRPPVYGGLSAISVVSATNIWAVGSASTLNLDIDTPFTEHWDGTTWSVVASPNPAGNDDTGFSAVAGIPGSNYVWAVGGEGFSTARSPYDSNTLTAYYC